MSDSTLERILNQATQQAEAAEVYYLSSQDTPITFENNRLKSLQTKAREGIALRLVCNGRLGFASSTDLSRLDELVSAAVQTSEIGAPVEFELARDVQLTTPKSNFQPPPTQEWVEVGQGLIEQVHAYNPDILVDVGFHIRSSSVKIATTSNVWTQRSRQILSASLSGNLVKGEDFLQAYSYDIQRDGLPNCDRIRQDLLLKYCKVSIRI
ncbi:PmbA/TldA family metallopeptidase [Coleofasciculus sp.]|uniref:PmbA/TldA family metallopeptidase n=1 Tax=Coleofasciculus sp. TaxID=3100458 RepID=UPI003A21EBA2